MRDKKLRTQLYVFKVYVCNRSVSLSYDRFVLAELAPIEKNEF